MPGRVVVVGSINVDLVVSGPRLPGPGETVVGGTFARHDGGKGANQAVAAARLGVETVLVGAVGTDSLGDEALAALERADVDVRFVSRVDGATGVALILVAADGENLISVASGANARVAGRDVTEALGALGLRAADVVLASAEVPDAAVAAGLAAARRAGARAILNPAPAEAVHPGTLRLATVLTPNRGEAAALSGETAAPERQAAVLLAANAGVEAVVVTLGPDGALLVDRARTLRVPAPAVEAVDATGAGDAFSGCLAAALSAGLELEDAVRRAVVAGALATTRPGAREGMPTMAEVEAGMRVA